ncbi:MAG TPA: WbqC family protein [Burkholderiaceae bacterium]|nr:WbqC family protein [Burkholderiaceae bacterium]
MRVGIMQPYFFPYVGYFQLMAAVDVFVLHDDVQFIKAGWVHRNRFLLNGEAAWFGLQLAQGPSTALIREREIAPSFDATQLVRRIAAAYHRAPERDAALQLLQDVLAAGDRGLADVNERGLRRVGEFLRIATPIVRSSSLQLDPELRAQARVIEIVRRMRGDTYVNPIGGLELYDEAAFAEAGQQLRFHRCGEVAYPQFGSTFVPSLSILDVLMFNAPASVAAMLRQCRIDTPAAMRPAGDA